MNTQYKTDLATSSHKIKFEMSVFKKNIQNRLEKIILLISHHSVKHMLPKQLGRNSMKHLLI